MRSEKRFPRLIPGDEHGPSRLLEFLALHTGMGAGIGISFAALAVLTDFAGIGTLMKETSDPVIPMVLLFASFALTFASLKVGIAVMSLPLDPPDREEGQDSADDGTPREPPEPPSFHVAEKKPEPAKEPEEPNRLLGRRE
ncbi:MAG: hypothetical protein JNM89_13420 [Hyphomicrobiaceae bacterium]|nr:hypothetical protein [Hyphomicrobiaceae bacterium]